MVASTDQKARLFDLETSINKMVVDGSRDAHEVADILQVVKDHKDFANYLRMGLEIRIPALSGLTKSEICRKYGFKDVVDNSPMTEVVMVLETVFRDGERSITGSEYEDRLKSVSGTLGLSQALWLIDHQDEFPEFMALLGKVYIYFPATIVVFGDDSRRVPFLDRCGARWHLGWRWLDGGFGSNGRVARSRPSAGEVGK